MMFENCEFDFERSELTLIDEESFTIAMIIVFSNLYIVLRKAVLSMIHFVDHDYEDFMN